MLRTLIVLVGILAAMSPGALAQTVVQPDLGGPQLEVIAPASAFPAKARVNIFFQLVNFGPGTITNVSLLAQPAAGSLTVIGQAERNLDDIPENDSAVILVRVATPDTAGSGSLTLAFTYRDEAGVVRQTTRTVTVQVAPPVSDPLTVDYVPEPLGPGGTGNLSMTLTNTGERAITNLDVTIQSDAGEFPLGGALTGGITSISQTLTPGAAGSLVVQGATLEAGDSAGLRVPVVTSLRADDLLPFTIIARYTFEGFQRERRYDFGAQAVGDVKIRVLEAKEVATSSGLELVGTIVNVGTATAWNPRVDVASGSGLVAESPKLISDLEPNDAVDFRIPVERIAEADPGAPLLVLDYNDAYGEVHPQTVSGDYVPLPPPEPGRIERAWGWISSPTGLLVLGILGALVAALVVAAIVHAVIVHRRERKGEAPGAEGSAKKERTRDRRDKHRPKPG